MYGQTELPPGHFSKIWYSINVGAPPSTGRPSNILDKVQKVPRTKQIEITNAGRVNLYLILGFVKVNKTFLGFELSLVGFAAEEEQLLDLQRF